MVNSGTCYRPPLQSMLKWRNEAGFELADPDQLNPFVDDVWQTLQIAPVPLDVMGPNGRTAMLGAEKLGWANAPLDRNAPGCGGCCQCAIGCPQNAKFGVHLNALPQACEAGARIISDSRVTKIIHEGDRAIGVEIKGVNNRKIILYSSRIVVACGATETPGLLRRSGIGKHPGLGKHLALHPAVAAGGRFEEPIVPWKGVLQSAQISEFHESDGILIEATSTPPGMGSMTMPGTGGDLIRNISIADHMCTLGAMIGDESSGRVLGSKIPVITYAMQSQDGARLIKAIWAMGKVLFSAGATEVFTGMPQDPIVANMQELEDAVSRTNWKSLHVAAFHPTGTASAGANPQRYPVGPTGRLRGISGVWVADASIIPSCPEVNPQVSIMALAQSVAASIIN